MEPNGVIVDVSGDVGDWDIITPKHITSKVEVKKRSDGSRENLSPADVVARLAV